MKQSSESFSVRRSPNRTGSPTGLEAVEHWRSDLLNRLIRYCLGVIAFTGATLALNTGGRALQELGLLGLAFLGISVAAVLKKSPLAIRASVFAISIVGVIVTFVVSHGVAVPTPYVAVMSLVTLVGLTAGRRAAWITLLGFSGALIAIGWKFANSPLQLPRDFHRADQFAFWVRIAMVFAAIGATTIAAINFLTRKLETAISHNKDLLEELQTESHENLTALQTQHRLEEQLRQAHQLEALGQLASGVAHDFNNLLVVILNHAQFAQLNWKRLTNSSNTDLDVLQQAGERASDLAQQLLTFGGGNVSERKRFDFGSAVAQSLKLLQRVLPSNIRWDLDLKDSSGVVLGVRIELDQIVFNLCVNARDAMPRGGTLAIRTSIEHSRAPGARTAQDFACLTIRDTGAGMDDMTRARLFEPFFTTKVSGTGLGLSVVHGALRQHGGFIEVESERGVGTTFRVFLPSTNEQAASSSVTPRLATPLRTDETLLVVDDDMGVRNVMQQLLETAGYSVLVCKDGQTAIEQFEKHRDKIALVITDAVMPHMDGRELYECIHSLAPQLPFLFCSGYTSGTLPAEFFDDPRRSLLGKPFKQKHLLEAIRQLLDR